MTKTKKMPRKTPTKTTAHSDTDHLLLGEWACLGILYRAPSHGFAIAAELKPDAEIGRIWSLSRPLTYRSLDQLMQRGLIEPRGEEPGIAGGNRTVLSITRAGRAALRRWVQTPVEHIRDLRSELLLKIAFATTNQIEIGDMLIAQHEHIETVIAGLEHALDTTDTSDSGTTPEPAAAGGPDVVLLWRYESATAALRFFERLTTPT